MANRFFTAIKEIYSASQLPIVINGTTTGTKSVREDISFASATVDPDAHLAANQGGSKYMREVGSRAIRDFSPFDQKTQREKAVQLYNSNPTARGLIEALVSYVVGPTPSYTVTDTKAFTKREIGRILDRFWYNPTNNFNVKIIKFAKNLLKYGEQLYPVFVDRDGLVTLGVIDPSLIKAVHIDQRNLESKLCVELVNDAPDGKRIFYKIINAAPRGHKHEGMLITADVGELVTGVPGLEEPTLYEGSAFYFSINDEGTRGISELTSMLDWLEILDQALYSESERLNHLKSYIWDVTLENATLDDVKEFLKNTPRPEPGTIRAHNEKIKWQAISPDLQTIEVTRYFDTMLAFISNGVGLHKSWMNSSEANPAKEVLEPSFRRMSILQVYIRFMITYILTFVLDQAAIHGMATKPKKQVLWPVDIILPETRPSNMKQTVDSFLVVSQAIAYLVQDNVIDSSLAQQAVKIVLGQLGIDVDLEELEKRVEEEKAKKQADQLNQDRISTQAGGNDRGAPMNQGKLPQNGRPTPLTALPKSAGGAK